MHHLYLINLPCLFIELWRTADALKFHLVSDLCLIAKVRCVWRTPVVRQRNYLLPATHSVRLFNLDASLAKRKSNAPHG